MGLITQEVIYTFFWVSAEQVTGPAHRSERLWCSGAAFHMSLELEVLMVFSSSKTSLVLRNLLSSKCSQLCLSSTASLGYVSHTFLSLPVLWCHQAFWTVGEKFIWEECAPVPYSPQLPLMDVFQDNLNQSAPVRPLSEGSYQMNAMWKLGLGRVGVCHSVKNWGTNSALSLHRGGEKCFLQLLGMIYT